MRGTSCWPPRSPSREPAPTGLRGDSHRPGPAWRERLYQQAHHVLEVLVAQWSKFHRMFHLRVMSRHGPLHRLGQMTAPTTTKETGGMRTVVGRRLQDVDDG
jgi:hypothetical protein